MEEVVEGAAPGVLCTARLMLSAIREEVHVTFVIVGSKSYRAILMHYTVEPDL